MNIIRRLDQLSSPFLLGVPRQCAMPVTMKFSPTAVRTSPTSGRTSPSPSNESSGGTTCFAADINTSPSKGSHSFGRQQQQQQQYQQQHLQRLAGGHAASALLDQRLRTETLEAAAAAAQFVALRISLKSDNDALVDFLASGAAKVGRGMTSHFLRGRYEHGRPLYGLPRDDLGGANAAAIVTDAHLRPEDAGLAPPQWQKALGHFAERAQIGCVILAGDAASFAEWARIPAVRSVCACVPDGRLYALIDGHLISISSQAKWVHGHRSAMSD